MEDYFFLLHNEVISDDLQAIPVDPKTPTQNNQKISATSPAIDQSLTPTNSTNNTNNNNNNNNNNNYITNNKTTGQKISPLILGQTNDHFSSEASDSELLSARDQQLNQLFSRALQALPTPEIQASELAMQKRKLSLLTKGKMPSSATLESEIYCRIRMKHSNGYLPGAAFSALISFEKFHNSGPTPKQDNTKKGSQSSSPASSTLPIRSIDPAVEWASACIFGEAIFDLKNLGFTNKSQMSAFLPPHLVSSLGRSNFTNLENTLLIFSSPASVLGSEFDLPVTYQYETQIPFEIPASYRGNFIRFQYFLVVTMQLQNAQKQTTQKKFLIPLKIFNPASSLHKIGVFSDPSMLSGFKFKFDSHVTRLDLQGPKSTLPDRQWMFKNLKNHLPNEVLNQQRIDVDLKNVAALLSGSGHSSVTNLEYKNENLLQVSINKTAFQLGETIFVTVRLNPQVDPTCYQISMRLESEEIVEVPNATKSGPKQDPKTALPSQQKKFKSELGECTEYTQHLEQTFLQLQIPFGASHQFSTELVSLKYFLSFEFLVGKEFEKPPSGFFGFGPTDPTRDVLRWVVPIKIVVERDVPFPLSESDHLFYVQ